MQNNCKAGPLHVRNTALDSVDAKLKRLYGELSNNRVPLKPFQCLLLTNANTFYLYDSAVNSFWLDDLYVGVVQPRTQLDINSANVVSVGPPVWDIGNVPLNVFLTNITMH